MQEVVIVSAVRTAVGRGKKGTLTNTRPDDLAALVLQEVLRRVNLEASHIEDVVMGCAMPEGEQGLNIARQASLLAGYPDSVPGVTVNRFCSSGLQAIAQAAQAIQSGMIDCAVAGGVESMSQIPMGGFRSAVNPRLLEKVPGAYMGMGHTAERLAAKYGITRQEADEFALNSHLKAAAAQGRQAFEAEIVAVPVRHDVRKGATITSTVKDFSVDELVRNDATLESMSKLKPSFKPDGVTTPGNASPLSDGAAALLLMTRAKAEALGLKPLARFVSFAVAGVPPEIMGIGPAYAIPKALQKANRKLSDVAVIELNEAFAAQALAVGRELTELDFTRVNPNGGAIALGHPLGCTGAKLTVSVIHELRRRGGGLGMITMCIGGGQGAAGLIEVMEG
ncbi:thiolase family protein [bacterium]|nr:thiolase family protein [bacterium]